MDRNRLIIAGGTGFIGQSLISDIQNQFDDIVVLTRSGSRDDGKVRYINWDAKTPGPWSEAMDGATAIVNVVGRTVDCRKTAANKAVILSSRVDSVNALAAGWRSVRNPPKVWIQSATAHIYGDTEDEALDESSPIGTGFAPMVGTAWEKTFADANLPGVRRVVLRISFVLGKNAGALRTLGRLARLGLGGTVGNGRQYLSWLHVGDLNRIIAQALIDQSMEGMYIATSPQPVTNAAFMKALRKAVHRPWSPPVPVPLVRLGAWMMRTDPELALLGRRLMPTRLMKEGFAFRFPDLNDALVDLLR